MRVLTLDQAAEYMQSELGMDVTPAWVKKQAEPNAHGKRGLPVFKITPGQTATLYTTDEALTAHFRKLASDALESIHGQGGVTSEVDSNSSTSRGKQAVARGVPHRKVLQPKNGG